MILNSPILLVLFTVAFLLTIFNAVFHLKTPIVAIITAVLVLGGIVYAFTLGASMQEVVIILVLFALVNIPAFKNKESVTSAEESAAGDNGNGV